MHQTDGTTSRTKRTRLRISIVVLFLGSVLAPALSWAITYGVRCQSGYQNTWRPTWNNTSECRRFSDGFSSPSNTRLFSYTDNGMKNVKYKFVDPNDGSSGGPDSVDLTLISVHG